MPFYALAVLIQERRDRSRTQIGFPRDCGICFGGGIPLSSEFDTLVVGLRARVALRNDKFRGRHAVKGVLAQANVLPDLIGRAVDRVGLMVVESVRNILHRRI